MAVVMMAILKQHRRTEHPQADLRCSARTEARERRSYEISAFF
jgi:hypothetical protein